MATRRDAQSPVLNPLKLQERRSGGVWRPNRSSIINARFNVDLVDTQERLLLTTPTGTRQRTEDTKLAAGASHDFLNMVTEAKMGVKVNTKDSRRLVERYNLTIDENLGMDL